MGFKQASIFEFSKHFKMILIYNDAGVSRDSINALQKYFPQSIFVSGKALQKKEILYNATLLIVPGGRSLPFYQSLGKTGNDNIKTFVEQGGCYVGL